MFGGQPGAADTPPPAFAPIVINEALTHTDPPLTDSIELYNPTASPVDLSGWFLTDDFGKPTKYRMTNGTIIPAMGYLVFYESNSFGLGPSAFGLSSKGDAVYLFSGDGASTNLTGYFHGFDFGAQQYGVSFGRYVISTGNDHFVAQTTSTLGGPNPYPKVGPVVISEINYHPPDVMYGNGLCKNNEADEYIELQNITGSPAPLYDVSFPTNTWKLRDAVDFVFPPNTSIPGNSTLLVVPFDPNTNAATTAAWRVRNGVAENIPLCGPFDGVLNNAGDSVELARPDVPQMPPAPDAGFVPYILVDKVKYSDEVPWPIAADGLGPTLQRRSATGYGNDPSNWVAAARSPGGSYAGGTSPTITSQPMGQTVVGNSTAMLSVGASGPNLSYQWLFNGSVISGARNSVLTLTNVQPSQSGQYVAVVMNPAGSVSSIPATLTVLVPVSITLQPAPLSGRPGTNATFTVLASGPRPISYQWRFNGVNIPGATSPSLTINNVQPANDGFYSVVCSDAVSSVTSISVRLMVLVDPIIIINPLSQSVVTNGTVVLSVTVSNTATFPIGYRWRKNGSTFAFYELNAYTGFLTVSNVNAGTNSTSGNTNWTVVVTNVAKPSGNISSAANLTILADSDGNGIPDSYEADYNLNSYTNCPSGCTNSVFDPNDVDCDGYSNLEEYIAGTNPTNCLSYPKINSISPGPTLRFDAVSNRTYTIQFKTNVDDAVWQKLLDIGARTTNRTEQVTDPSPNSNHRVYRTVTPGQP